MLLKLLRDVDEAHGPRLGVGVAGGNVGTSPRVELEDVVPVAAPKDVVGNALRGAERGSGVVAGGAPVDGFNAHRTQGRLLAPAGAVEQGHYCGGECRTDVLVRVGTQELPGLVRDQDARLDPELGHTSGGGVSGNQVIGEDGLGDRPGGVCVGAA